MEPLLLALTWNHPEEIPFQPAASRGWRRYLLYPGPMLALVLALAISSHGFRSSRWIWGCLIAAMLGIVSVRQRIGEMRQSRALARLHASNNLLRAVIDSTSEVVCLKDLQGRYLLVNPAGARFLQRTQDEALGKSDYDLFSRDDADAIRKVDQEVINSGKTVTVERELTLPDCRGHTLLVRKSPYRNSQGEIVGVVGISLDITERRCMEAHLQKTQRMESIGTFSGGIAHDFNNLLNVIKGCSYLVQSEATSNPRIRENIDHINQAVARASSLIDHLLAFSRQQILQPRVISVNDIVSNLRPMLDRLIGEDVQIQTRLSPGLAAVKADPARIEQVLLNLVANARDAMPEGGTLTVETSEVTLNSSAGPDHDVPPGSYICMKVRDTGTGMDAQTRARMFEPFFTTKPPGKGTGLGLATVYGIIKQSGGHLGVESTVGSGTTFRIYLPPVSEPVEFLSQVTANAIPHGAGRTILVVDDDPQVRQLVRNVLTTAGFKVLEAENGEHAERLAVMQAHAIDLVLTNVIMPRISGGEVARHICGNGRKTRVIYMSSGYPVDTIAPHGVVRPGIALLSKPFSPDRLLERVSEALQAPAAEFPSDAA